MSPWSPALSTSGSTGWFVSRTLGVCFNSGPTWHLWGVCSRFRIRVSNGDSYPLSGKANLVLCVCALWLAFKSRVTFSTNQKQSRAKWWRNLVLRFSYKKCFRILRDNFFLSALQAALSGGVMKVSCFVCAINPKPCQFSLSLATLEPRRKLGPVNFRKDFRDCY